MSRALALPAAAGASLALHAGFAALMALALAPQPFAPQPQPESRLAVEAWEVDRSEARPAEPEADAAQEADRQDERTAAGAVPQSRAGPAEVRAEAAVVAAPAAEVAPPAAAEAPRLAAARPDAAAAEASTVPAEPARASEPAAESASSVPPASPAAVASPAEAPALPAAEAVAPALAAAEAVAPALAAAEAAAPILPAAPAEAPLLVAAVAPAPDLPAATPAAAPAPAAAATAAPAATAQPEAAVVASAAPPSPAAEPRPAEGPAATEARPDAAVVSGTAPQGEAAPAQAPPAEKGTAELAWAGPEGILDPAALDTIQALMQPGDPGSEAARLRDGIAGLLASVPCSRLQVEFDPERGALLLRGHVPADGAAADVLAGLSQSVGGGLPVVDETRLIGQPLCGVVSGMDASGLPQSDELLTDSRIVGRQGEARTFHFSGGQSLNLCIGGADYPAALYLDYFAADGQVVHMTNSVFIPTPLLAPKEVRTFRQMLPPEHQGQFAIGPPYGTELVVAFAASRELFDAPRPNPEPAADYLAALAERVAAARAEDPGFKGEWVYFLIETQASHPLASTTFTCEGA